MVNVEIEIQRLVVHGVERFVGESFAELLREEIARRIVGLETGAIVEALRTEVSSVPSARMETTIEASVAARTAAQLFAGERAVEGSER